jgi:hypothetical protein
MVLNYKVAYISPTNFLVDTVSQDGKIAGGVSEVVWVRNIHPKDDNFQFTVAKTGASDVTQNHPFMVLTTNNNPSSGNPNGEVLSVSKEIFIYRKDNTTNTDTQKTMFAGIITSIDYSESASEAWSVTVKGRGLWYALQTRLVSIPTTSNSLYANYVAQGKQYPVFNAWIPILNPALSFDFNFLFKLITNYFSSQHVAQAPFTAIDSTDFPTFTTQLSQDAVQGSNQLVVNTGTAVNFTSGQKRMGTDLNGNPVTVWVGGDLIYIAGLHPDITHPENVPSSTNGLGESAVIQSIDSTNTTITLTQPLKQTHYAGNYVWNNIVNDQMFLRYMSVDSAIERLLQSSINTGNGTQGQGAIGEISLNFRLAQPTLMVKQFDGVSKFGVGSDRRNDIIYYESDDIVNIDFGYDYESMSNSMVFSGEQFKGAEVAAAERFDATSINKYGLKQVHKSAGNVADPLEINRYMNNIFPLLKDPIPTMSAWLVHDQPNSLFPEPGDLISIYSPSLSDIILTNNPNSYSFAARIREIEVRWNVDGGEKVEITFTYPVTQGAQWLSKFSSKNMLSAIGKLQEEVRSALTMHEGGIIQNQTNSFTFTITDRMTGGSNTQMIPQFYAYNLNIANILLADKGLLLGQSFQSDQPVVMPTIYGIWMTCQAVKDYITSSLTLLDKNNNLATTTATLLHDKIHVKIIQPDGLIIFDDHIFKGEKFDVLSIILQKVGYSSGSIGGQPVPTGPIPLNQLNGDYIILFYNHTALPDFYQTDTDLIVSQLSSPSPQTADISNYTSILPLSVPKLVGGTTSTPANPQLIIGNPPQMPIGDNVEYNASIEIAYAKEASKIVKATPGVSAINVTLDTNSLVYVSNTTPTPTSVSATYQNTTTQIIPAIGWLIIKNNLSQIVATAQSPTVTFTGVGNQQIFTFTYSASGQPLSPGTYTFSFYATSNGQVVSQTTTITVTISGVGYQLQYVTYSNLSGSAIFLTYQNITSPAISVSAYGNAKILNSNNQQVATGITNLTVFNANSTNQFIMAIQPTLTAGTYTFQFWATDASSNIISATTTLSLTIGGTGLGTSSFTYVSNTAPSIDAVSVTYNNTTSQTLSVTGYCTILNSSGQIVSSGQNTQTANPSSNVTFNISYYPNLASGTYTFQFYVITTTNIPVSQTTSITATIGAVGPGNTTFVYQSNTTPSATGVNVTYLNTYSQSLNASAYCSVTNSSGQIVATANSPFAVVSANATNTYIIQYASLTAGTYSFSFYMISDQNAVLSQTTTISSTISSTSTGLGSTSFTFFSLSAAPTGNGFGVNYTNTTSQTVSTNAVLSITNSSGQIVGSATSPSLSVAGQTIARFNFTYPSLATGTYTFTFFVVSSNNYVLSATTSVTQAVG